MLKASVGAGQSGPVILLAGEADLTSAGELSALISTQLAAGTQELTIDVAGLRFADSASIRTLVLAARTLKERGGRLVLLDPQRAVTRVLTLLGADQMFHILETPGMRHGQTAAQHDHPRMQSATDPGPAQIRTGPPSLPVARTACLTWGCPALMCS